MEDNKKSGAKNYGMVRPRKKSINSQNSERRSFGDRPERRTSGEHKTYGDRPERRTYGERKTYGDRPERRTYGERKTYGDRPERRTYGEHKTYGDRPERKTYGEHKTYGDRPERKTYGEHKSGFSRGGERTFSRGAGKPFRRRENDFGAKKGMDEMLSKRPLVSDMSDNDNFVEIPSKDVVRLNKYMANSGICSRREADNFIQAGVVTVNGEVVTELGAKVNILTDDVRFNGERLKGEQKVYIIMNKPKGYVTTASDPHADRTVMDLLKGCPARVFAVGRLDKNTTGVLMFTNDGEISEKLTHPSYDKKKIYQVTLDRDLKQSDYEKVLAGVELSDGPVAADDLQYIDENDHRKLGIEIHSGKNRVVRRIFESLGYDVKALDRVYFAGLTKKGLKRGEWRFLTEGETNILKMGAYR